MYGPGLPVLKTFSCPRNTATAGTKFIAGVPPNDMPHVKTYPVGPMGGTALIGSKVDMGRGKPHVTKVIYTTTSSTAHLISILRPLNFTAVNGAVAAGGTTINIFQDPGIYSTNYLFGSTCNGAPTQVADAGIAGGDYFAVQLADGTWWFSSVTSVSTLALTVPAIPTPTGSSPPGILNGAIFYWFGIATDTDPATGQVQPSTQIAASQTRDTSWYDPYYGVVSALHDGDPLLFYSPNPTAAGILEAMFGYYSDI